MDRLDVIRHIVGALSSPEAKALAAWRDGRGKTLVGPCARARQIELGDYVGMSWLAVYQWPLGWPSRLLAVALLATLEDPGRVPDVLADKAAAVRQVLAEHAARHRIPQPVPWQIAKRRASRRREVQYQDRVRGRNKRPKRATIERKASDRTND